MPDVIASAHHAGKAYGAGAGAVLALRDVSFELAAGEFVAVMGRSGCGKTTLLNLLAGLDAPTSGAVRLAGFDTARLDDDALTRLRRRTVGFVFQAFHLLPTLSAAENVELPLLLDADARARWPAARRAARVAGLLEQVGLGDRREAYPHQLSGGEQQRVALARALVHEPAFVAADEPTGNLDDAGAALVLDQLQALCREAGVAVLMATHSLEAAGRAGRIVKLRDGALEAAAGPSN